MRRSFFRWLLGAFGAAALFSLAAVSPALAYSSGYYPRTSCNTNAALCPEVAKFRGGYGYVGHDEPSLLFYSNTPGSGNQMTYQLTLPADPTGPFSLSKTYNFQLHPSFWFGMAMCATESYPETVKTCKPDSDANAVDVTKSTKHPGTGFMELQFYSPGWIKQYTGFSCAAHQWCAALVTFDFSLNPITGKPLNADCANKVGGLEYANFAYLTKTGIPQGPPNPLQFDPVKSGEPGPTVLYMSPGDKLTVSLHDSADGLVTTIVDHTTGQTGSMTASASNGFGQIKYSPAPGVCKEIPYTFHPMYSTSSPKTTVPWAAHSYNIAFSDEIGHFDHCTAIGPTGSCAGLEGAPGDQEPADKDDNVCFPASLSLFYPVTGCIDSNLGFDGVPYLRSAWPDGSADHPTPVLFTSPRTVGGAGYPRAGFETDLPAIEWKGTGGTCNVETGAGCTNPPIADEGQPAQFYPYYSTTSSGPGGACMWGLGAQLPNTIHNFGGNAKTEFGAPVFSPFYVVGGGTVSVIQNFRRVVPNPC